MAFGVAVTRRSGSFDPLLPELGACSGLAAFDLRTRLAVPDPALVLVTDDRARATAALACLRGAGHGAVACDLERVVSSADMHPLRDFALAEHGLVDVEGGEVLPWSELLVIVEALHSEAEEVSVTTRSRSLGDEIEAVHGSLDGRFANARVLYLFRTTGVDPWLVSDSFTRFGGLGASAGRTRREGLSALVVAIQAAAPIPHDDRLAKQKRPRRALDTGRAIASSEGVVTTTQHAGRAQASSNRGGTDVAAHLLALAIRSGQA
ncbi:MAG: hypothetical protein JNL79_30025 [Myxococcales bacterium]|nr:hypothetical protein [Myxococcales bacterium]